MKNCLQVSRKLTLSSSEGNPRARAPEMVKVEMELTRPFYDFLKQFLAFRGSQESVAELCTQLAYDHARDIYQKFHAFLGAELPSNIHGQIPWIKK